MSDVMENEAPRSVEFDLDRAIEELVNKMAHGDLTPADEEQFIGLLTQRSSRMKRSSMRRSSIPSRAKLSFAA